MAELKLRLQVEENAESTVTVDKEEFVIGRLPECDLYLPYFEISRYHARLLNTPAGVWVVEDMHSTNGTRLNDRLLAAPQTLNHGDVIQMGHVFMHVLLASSPQQKTQLNPINADPISEEVTILRNAKELQQQWIQADDAGSNTANPHKAIARLKDLVDIARCLNSAESIEAIFHQIQEIVFRDLISIDRLALLIDVDCSGQLELLQAAARDVSQQENLAADGSWISRTICQKVFTDKVAIKTADAQMDERFEGEHSILAKGIRSALAVPLWDENQVVGVLYADAHLSFTHWNKGGDEDLSFFSALANLVASAVQRWLLAEKLRSEASIRHRLERYHSPSVVQHIMNVGGLEGGRLTPTEGEISILFADIVGFTALSERLTPTEIANLLNSFFEEMLKEVFAARGTLDKFIGDCIMAFFGAPEPQPDHAERAFAAAWGMLERLERLNDRKFFQQPLQLRIAINSGKAVVGDVGSSQRVDYTVLGATINLASRMEGICPPGECVVSEATHSLLRDPKDLSPMGEYRFKGIDRPIRVYQTRRQSVIDDGIQSG
ncbi:adenylate/guanylate cyclase domain-containing protein [Coleofasciculus sp. FACHB-1120]|uniref:adenylate/guanylate cyclase domain-containing protein n=1 Tax=Coleofasciculus sp. FACHB-1120 TaxID=2692783 RepID=UPI0016835126|nr:adenylate/guanylate cyclase domain-containing protein [Coleofasciculus sp. FACHB-1120]MBD2744580.1 FHA domain-containing protein [Coleofasciculus sp. FACHB-1120]